MEKKLIKIDCRGIIRFIEIEAADAEREVKKLKEKFHGEVERDSKGNIKFFSGDDFYKAKGETQKKNSKIETIESILDN